MVQASDFYKQHFQGKGLAPRHVSGLKKELFRVFKAGESPMAAANAFLKTKGISIASKRSDPAKKEPSKKPVEVFQAPKEEIDIRLLKETLREIEKASGVKIDVPAQVTPDAFRKLVHEALVGLADPANKNTFDKIEGGKTKLFSVLKDCLGICIDLRNATCAVCPDQATCVTAFLGNLRDGWSALTKEHGLQLVDNGLTLTAMVDKYQASKMFVVFDVENPFSLDTQWHAVGTWILNTGSIPVGHMREMLEGHFGKMNDMQFLNWVEKLIAGGIGCLAEDLPKDVVAGLSKANRRALGL